jgi:hypothetical protein
MIVTLLNQLIFISLTFANGSDDLLWVQITQPTIWILNVNPLDEMKIHRLSLWKELGWTLAEKIDWKVGDHIRRSSMDGMNSNW